MVTGEGMCVLRKCQITKKQSHTHTSRQPGPSSRHGELKTENISANYDTESITCRHHRDMGTLAFSRLRTDECKFLFMITFICVHYPTFNVSLYLYLSGIVSVSTGCSPQWILCRYPVWTDCVGHHLPPAMGFTNFDIVIVP